MTPRLLGITVCALGVTLLVIHAMAKQTAFLVEIARTKTENGLVYGEIRVNNEPIGFTFENAELKIPAGSYKGILRYFSNHNFVQGPFGTLGREGDFLLEVEDQSHNRTNILLHAGNRPYQSAGCILLGPAETLPNGSVQIDVTHPLYKLRQKFYESDVPTSTPDRAISIKISE